MRLPPMERQQGQQKSSLHEQNAARERQPRQQQQQWRQPPPQEEVLRWPKNMISASSQRNSNTFSTLFPAAAVSCTWKIIKSALIWTASLVWSICHADGLLLLLATAPAASTAFTASLQGTGVLPGWQLLFSWQAMLPLFVLGCCCIALYRAKKYQSQEQQLSSSFLDPQLQQTPLNASVTCCCSFSAPVEQLHSVAVSTLQEEEQRHVLQEQRHPQKRWAFTCSEDNQLEEQLAKEKQLYSLPSSKCSVSLLKKQQQPLHHTRKSLQFGTEPAFPKEDAVVKDVAACKRQGTASSSFHRLIILGGYREWERCLDDFGAVPSDLSPAVVTAQHPAKVFFSRAESNTCAPSAEDGACRDNSSDVGKRPAASKSFNRLRLCWRRRWRRKQGSTTEAAATPSFSKLLTGFSSMFGRNRFQTLLSFEQSRRRPALVHCNLRRMKTKLSPLHCASHILKDSHDKHDETEEAEREVEEEEEEDTVGIHPLSMPCGSNSSSRLPSRNEGEILIVQKGRASKSEASQIAGGCPPVSGDSATSCRVCSTCFREGMDLAALPKNDCRPAPSSVFDTATSFPPRKRKEEAIPAGGVASSGSLVEVENQQRRRQGERGQGPRSSSALVAVLLFPAFICCWFPSVHNADKQAATSVGAAGAHISWEKSSSTNPHSSAHELVGRNAYFSSLRGDAAAYGGPPMASDVLRVMVTLLPTSVVAGSFVSLLLWHAPAAGVQLRELGWLVTAYAAALAATCCCSSHHIAIAAGLTAAHPREVDLVRKSGSVIPSPFSLLGSDRTIFSWMGSPLPAQLEVLCVYCVCAAAIGLCIALQLLYFHCCFRKAPHCFSLVEGSLVAQLATSLTYVSAAYTCCCYYASHDETPNKVSDRESFKRDVLLNMTSSIENASGVFASHFSDPSEPLRSQVLSVSNALHVPTEAAWRSFASHVWLPLLLLIACTLLLTIFDDESPVVLTDYFKKRGDSASSWKGEGATNHREDEQSDGDKILKRDCRMLVKVLISLFALALVSYLCCSPMIDLHLFSTVLAKPTSHASSSNPFIASSNSRRSERKEDLTSTAITSDRSTNSSGKISARGLGVNALLPDATSSGVAETPLTWVMHLIVNDPRHTWLFLLWLVLSVAGIPLVSAVIARASSLKDVATSTPCMDAGVVLAAAEAAYGSDSHCNHAAKNTLPAVGENCTNQERSALLKTFARKLFHFLLVAVVATGYYTGAHVFTALSLCGLLWIFVFCEYIRVSCVLPKLSSHLTEFFSRFVDCRDKNGLFLTHMYLLLGVALPFVAAVAQGDSVDVRAPMVTARNTTSNTTKIYTTPYSHRGPSPPLREARTMSNAVDARGFEDGLGLPVASATEPMRRFVTTRYEGATYVTNKTEETTAAISVSCFMALQSLLGLLLVGIGDAISALVGMTWGTRKMPFTIRKTCVGTAAFFASSAALILFFIATSRTTLVEKWISLRAGLFATGLATLFEAYTPDIDNCILSLFGVVAYNGAWPVL